MLGSITAICTIIMSYRMLESFTHFLPHSAILAWYMSLLCVSLSVCHKLVFY